MASMVQMVLRMGRGGFAGLEARTRTPRQSRAVLLGGGVLSKANGVTQKGKG